MRMYDNAEAYHSPSRRIRCLSVRSLLHLCIGARQVTNNEKYKASTELYKASQALSTALLYGSGSPTLKTELLDLVSRSVKLWEAVNFGEYDER